MTIKVRQLELSVTTVKGKYGVSIPFSDGFTILRAENTSGKSTCVQAIVYALGLEAMLGPSRETPLPPAMTKLIEDDGVEIPVLESSVFLEIENARGQVMTVQRTAAGSRDTRLISAWDGPLLTSKGATANQRDFFVRDKGAAQRPDGFHYHLAQFLEWNLPMVSKFDGSECPLYLECIFPIILVEQKHGWSSLHANMPTFFGIQEAWKRAVEFVLGLQAHGLIVEAQRLRQEEADARSRWKALSTQADALAETVGGVSQGVPSTPTADWPPKKSPSIAIPNEKNWTALSDVLTRDKAHLKKLQGEPVPTANQAADQVSKELDASRHKLNEWSFVASDLQDEVNAEAQQLESIRVRLLALGEDLLKNQDANKLRALGSTLQLSIAKDECPTCHQHVVDALLPQIEARPPMAIEDTITFIKQQKDLFQRMEANSQRVIQAKTRKLQVAQGQVEGLRGRIRALRETLVSDGRSPSVEAIQTRIRLEEDIRIKEKALHRFQGLAADFSDLAESWKHIQARRKALPKEGLSGAEKQKLNALSGHFKGQLNDYGFTSFDTGLIDISKETYRPTREGFDLGFDISASDNIRVIWAYLMALLEIARTSETNHPGILVFDEPRQQDASASSFQALLQRCVHAGNFQQQILIATSEPTASLRSMLAGKTYYLVEFEGKILKPIAR